MKNEGPFILEWIAFNRMIGVTDFLIYTNDCTDGTDELLDTLEDHGIVTRLPNPARPDQPYQMTALKAAPKHKLVRKADWVFVTDIDEFLDIRIGDGTIPELIEACENPIAISITMRMIANGGVVEFEDRPVIEQFTKSHDPELWNDQKAIEVKTLTRADFPLRFFGAHRPFLKRDHDHSTHPITWSDGSGRQVPYAFLTVANNRRRHRFPAEGASRFASLNHYTLRSLDSYLVKSHRGDVNRKARDLQVEYWAERNEDTHTETRILRHLPKLIEHMNQLRALEGVADAHEEAVARHKVLIRTLENEPAFSKLKEELVNISPALRAGGKAQNGDDSDASE